MYAGSVLSNFFNELNFRQNPKKIIQIDLEPMNPKSRSILRFPPSLLYKNSPAFTKIPQSPTFLFKQDKWDRLIGKRDSIK